MKTLYLVLVLFFTGSGFLSAQIVCIKCYIQNDSISSGVHNLLQNGGFENSTCAIYGKYCPNSSGYSCDINNWTCTGGGSATYACVIDGSLSIIPQGVQAVYFGNFYCNACSSNPDDTSCLLVNDCEVSAPPSGYPIPQQGYGGSAGLTLKQTVNGLVPGNVYVLEFWAGGEAGGFRNHGLFAVDVGFGNTFLQNRPSQENTTDLGTRFIIEFRATAASHTIAFTNWGHVCSSCSELMLDDARLYTLAELASSVPPCDSSFAASVQTTGTLCGHCNGGVKANVYNGASPYSFLWSTTDTTKIVNGLCPGSYIVTVTDAGGNTVTAAGTVVAAPPGTVTITPNLTTICPGDSTQLCAPSGFTNYTWNNGETGSCLFTGLAGNYRVTVSDGVGCSAVSNQITVAILPPPPVLVSVNGTSMTAYNAITYQWYLNGNIIVGATSANYVANQAGNYQVMVTDANGCSALSNGMLFNGIDDLAEEPVISLYPNPALNELTIEVGALQVDVLRIYGTDGKLMTEVKLPLNNRIDISALSRGVYVAEVEVHHTKTKLRWLKM